jgi:hypothetical protein
MLDSPSQLIQAHDVSDLLPGKTPSDISRQLRNLRDRQMLQPEKEGGRKYTIRFDSSYLLRSVMKMLDEKGFLPLRD